MKIIQEKNGDAIMMFSEQEIEIINKQKHFKMDAESLRHLTNHFLFIATQANKNFNEKTKDLRTTPNTEIETKE